MFKSNFLYVFTFLTMILSNKTKSDSFFFVTRKGFWMNGDDDGYLNFFDYIDSLSNELRQRDLKSFTNNVFKYFDRDLDGYLNIDEYRQLDSILPYPSNKTDMKKDLIESIAKNGINYEGLIRFLNFKIY